MKTLDLATFARTHTHEDATAHEAAAVERALHAYRDAIARAVEALPSHSTAPLYVDRAAVLALLRGER